MKRGQALLELAVFGSLMIMVLGAIVNYGLNADSNQRAMMSSFRQALSSAAKAPNPANHDPVSVSHLVIQSKHFPDPSNPFAIGSMVPATASAGGIARSNMLGRVFPDRPEELPRIQMTLSGTGPNQQVRCATAPEGCTTANLRAENVPEGSIGRYREVFGGGNVCDCDEKASCNVNQPLCVGLRASGQHRLLILDQCDGEVLDYDGCKRQARLIIDPSYCQQECEKGGAENCAATCAQPMTAPWYADGKPPLNGGAGPWVFPKLDKLFSATTRLGLQGGMTTSVGINNRLKSDESGKDVEDPDAPSHAAQTPAIATTSSIDWTERSTRNLTYHTSGTGTATTPVSTSITRQSTTRWHTPWETK